MTEKEKDFADRAASLVADVTEHLASGPGNARMWLKFRAGLETALLRIGQERPRVELGPGRDFPAKPLAKAQPVLAESSDVLAYSEEGGKDPLPKPRKVKARDIVLP